MKKDIIVHDGRSLQAGSDCWVGGAYGVLRSLVEGGLKCTEGRCQNACKSYVICRVASIDFRWPYGTCLAIYTPA